jgi:hypothetical protein
VLARPHAAGASEAALDLVEHEDRPRSVAQLPQAAQEAVRRNDDAAVALDRLDEHTRGRLDSGRGIGERVLEQRQRRLAGIAVPGPGAPERIRIRDEDRLGDDPELLAVGALACVAQGSDTSTRVGAREGDHVAATGRGTGELDGHLVRHRPGDGEQDAIELGRRDCAEPLVELGPYLGRRS